MLLMLVGGELSPWVREGNTELVSWIVIGGSIALTFPSGLLLNLVGFYAAMDIVKWIGLARVQHLPAAAEIPMSFLLIVLWETSMLVVGYYQWFWLVPRLYSWSRRILHSRRGGGAVDGGTSDQKHSR